MNKNVIIGAAGVLAMVALVAAFFSAGAKPPTSAPVANQNSAPAYQNESAITNVGVTSDQLQSLEQVLSQYLSSQNKSPKKIGFVNVKHISVDRNARTPIWTIGFDVQLDERKVYQAKMSYFNLTGIRLILYNADSSKLLFDSQNIGGSPDEN